MATLFQRQHGTGPDDDTVLGVKTVRFHQVELDHQLLPLFKRAGTFLGGLFHRQDVARAPQLHCGRFAIGALDLVEVHHADRLFGFVFNRPVAMRHKPDNDHAAACQELLNSIFFFHLIYLWLAHARGDATAFAVGFTNVLSFSSSVAAGRAGGAATIHNGRLYIGRFIDWLAERGVLNAQDAPRPMLERYQRVLFHHREQDGQPLSFAGQHVRLTTIQGFFKWLCRKYYITANPAADLELPKVEKRLPRQVLTAHEAEQVLSQPDLSTPVGIRDRAILEILYSTGMRRKELTGLRLYDLDLERGTVMIREGKGKRDRLLPIGARHGLAVQIPERSPAQAHRGTG